MTGKATDSSDFQEGPQGEGSRDGEDVQVNTDWLALVASASNESEVYQMLHLVYMFSQCSAANFHQLASPQRQAQASNAQS